MPAGVVLLDAKGIVRQANHLAKVLLGEPLEGQVWRNIIHRSFQPRADDGHEVSLHDGRRVKLSITPLLNEPGQLIVLTDLTETRQLQDKISHMQRLSSLGKMVASLAHQIRTPLSAALLYAGNLASGKLNDAARAAFSVKLLHRLNELESQVNDMLLLAKNDTQLSHDSFSLTDLLQDVAKGAEAMLSQHNAHLTIDSPAEACALTGNKSALSGALHNLIHNSLMPGATEICIRASQSCNNQIEIKVQDNGPGIPEAIHTRIFEPFFTTKQQGTGLGLAVVKSVVNNHQGKVWLGETTSQGTCFHIHLPTRSVNNPIHSELQEISYV
jgi:two-component system sensor histidine kinase FlrB